MWEGGRSCIRQNTQDSGGGSALLSKRKTIKLPLSGRYTLYGISSRKVDGEEGTGDHSDNEGSTDEERTRRVAHARFYRDFAAGTWKRWLPRGRRTPPRSCRHSTGRTHLPYKVGVPVGPRETIRPRPGGAAKGKLVDCQVLYRTFHVRGGGNRSACG